MAILCPLCEDVREPALQVGTVAVCGNCGGSLRVHDAVVTAATASDIDTLSASDVQQLRVARGRIARPERRQRR